MYFKLGIIRYDITNKACIFGQNAVYGLVSPSQNSIWPSASLRAILNSSLACSVRKLPHCPKSHVLFVNYVPQGSGQENHDLIVTYYFIERRVVFPAWCRVVSVNCHTVRMKCKSRMKNGCQSCQCLFSDFFQFICDNFNYNKITSTT